VRVGDRLSRSFDEGRTRSLYCDAGKHASRGVLDNARDRSLRLRQCWNGEAAQGRQQKDSELPHALLLCLETYEPVELVSVDANRTRRATADASSSRLEDQRNSDLLFA